MKWYALLPIAAIAAVPAPRASAQATIRTVSIGHIQPVDNRAASLWGMSGMSIFEVKETVGGNTPIMRTEAMDARTVEILSRTEVPPLMPRDVRAVERDGRHFITVRNYLLFEVTPKDARADNTDTASLTRKWAARVRQVLPQVAPAPNRFGV